MVDKQKDGMMSRWSERKQKVQEEAEAEAAVKTPEEEEAELSEHEALLEANREEAESIDLDTIDEESDLSLFMKEGVPDYLKRKALSTLWRSSPVFANIDGLNDYDEDFGDESLIMKTFKSAYQIGSGYAKEVIEEQEEELVAAIDPDAASTDLQNEELEGEEAEGEDLDNAEAEETLSEHAEGDMSEDDDNASNDASESEEMLGFETADANLDDDEILQPVRKVSLRKRLALDS